MTLNTTSRPPIIAVMGHVDHGKSTLLDYIRKTNVTEHESGGITQHISAYEVEHKDENNETKRITFLDTPGHEAFSAIRTRGAQVADIAILVVAADDGVKPQTLEAHASIKQSGIPFIVALNKIDKPGINIESIKANLAEHEIYLEGYGGDVPFVPVSALKGDGVSDLLDTILLVAEVEELTGTPEASAEGFIVESNIDPQQGIRATLIVTDGTLATGSFVISGESFAPVRYIDSFAGEKVASVSLSQPASITGWSSLPCAGEMFTVVDTKREAEDAIYEASQKADVCAPQAAEKDSEKLAIPVIIKADAYGTLDAVIHEVGKLELERVYPQIILAGIGAISESDMQLALAKEGTLVVGFNTKVESRATHVADRAGITPEVFSVIYKLTEWLEAELTRRSPTVDTEETTAEVKILKVFSANKKKQVIGGRVESGTLKKNSAVQVVRRDNVIGDGVIKEIQHNKAPVDTISEGNEFGCMVESKIELAPGDYIQSVHIVTT